MSERVQEVLAEVRRNGSKGNPDGYTEVHAYHVWEVLAALERMEHPGITTEGEV